MPTAPFNMKLDAAKAPNSAATGLLERGVNAVAEVAGHFITGRESREQREQRHYQNQRSYWSDGLKYERHRIAVAKGTADVDFARGRADKTWHQARNAAAKADDAEGVTAANAEVRDVETGERKTTARVVGQTKRKVIRTLADQRVATSEAKGDADRKKIAFGVAYKDRSLGNKLKEEVDRSSARTSAEEYKAAATKKISKARVRAAQGPSTNPIQQRAPRLVPPSDDK